MIVSIKCLLVALLSIGLLEAFKLDFAANSKLQETCGHDMREIQKYARKVLNGTAAKGGESPWTAAVYIVDHEEKTLYTTGTIISKRHILTYDQLVVMNTTNHGLRLRHDKNVTLGDEYHTCEGDDLVLPRSAARRVNVYLDMLRVDRFESKHMLGLRKITILGGCKKPYTLNKVTVLELTRDITAREKAKPICLTPSSSTSSFTFYGYGDNRGDVLDATLRHTSITVVPCTETVAEDIFCVKSEQPLCNGDFGGGAIHRVGHKVINAYGIYMDGPDECSKANKDTIYKFANLTSSKIRESVCEATGVCDPTHYNPTSTGDADPQATGRQINGTISGGISDDGSIDSTGTCTRGVKNYGVCSDASEDGDIHIHIKLGKFKLTKNPEDIEIVRQVGSSSLTSKAAHLPSVKKI